MFGLAKPVGWIGILLAGIGGHGLLGRIGLALAVIGFTTYWVLAVIGLAFMRRWKEQQTTSAQSAAGQRTEERADN